MVDKGVPLLKPTTIGDPPLHLPQAYTESQCLPREHQHTWAMKSRLSSFTTSFLRVSALYFQELFTSGTLMQPRHLPTCGGGRGQGRGQRKPLCYTHSWRCAAARLVRLRCRISCRRTGHERAACHGIRRCLPQLRRASTHLVQLQRRPHIQVLVAALLNQALQQQAVRRRQPEGAQQQQQAAAARNSLPVTLCVHATPPVISEALPKPETNNTRSMGCKYCSPSQPVCRPAAFSLALPGVLTRASSTVAIALSGKDASVSAANSGSVHSRTYAWAARAAAAAWQRGQAGVG